MLSVIQGDSYAHDFTSPDISTFDGNWTGSWALVPALGETAVLTGSLTKSQDLKTLMVRITPAQSESLEIDSYILVVQVSNSALGFKQEILQESFVVHPQGISG